MANFNIQKWITDQQFNKNNRYKANINFFKDSWNNRLVINIRLSNSHDE